MYGPVVRIGPNEIHVNDPDFYDVLYAGPTRRRHKDPWFLSSIAPGMSFAASNYDHHRARRSGLSPFFSKTAVRGWEPVIHENLQRLCQHFERANETSQLLELHTCFVNFAVDTVSQYVFGKDSGFDTLKEPILTEKWKKGVNGIFELLLLVRHFPWMYFLSRVFPVWFSRIFFPAFGHAAAIERDVEKHTLKAYNRHSASELSIIDHIIRNNKLPPAERTLARLTDEAKFLLVAGTDAPSQVMAITMYHVLSNLKIHNLLQEELQITLPDASVDASWSDLERLPYLTAVISEGLRLSAVVTSRLPRIAPDEDLVCHGWRIPAGTSISMSNHFVLRDATIFADPLVFHPERWLSSSSTLSRYLVPFSKGSQGCLGPNMAWSWLYIGLATLLRRFRLELVDTDESNVTIVRDCFNGQTSAGKNRIQVRVC
ncbi:putative cytochrome P450 [Penicillium brasilianum]|uniref:Putative cytochrome P450 n=1 Tax=Penicillium brasilianum TaxID=104259 RepID=A0A1S9RA84_PENBI|nr:putative cytochrome P450 [Penicillium brasilianum]